MAVRVEVNPELLAWARERAGLELDDLTHRFPKLEEWEQGDRSPTLKQLENFAQATHTPIGFLFLPEPPDEQVPIPDYRTIGDIGVRRPSPDLLDTIYQCEQRQNWYREYAQANGDDPVDFVGSLTMDVPIAEAAAVIRGKLEFGADERGSSWSEALRLLIEHAENLGVLVMINGVVGSNTHRKLDPQEFRGFALTDPFAPLVFVNGADTKAAQIFTLVHELVHLWLGETALDNANMASAPAEGTERWCNEVAAEVLVPLTLLLGELRQGEPLADALDRLARSFKVSTLVIVRRIYDAGGYSWDQYRAVYERELAQVLERLRQGSDGGNFFNTQPVRVSRRFARAVIGSTLEGQTLHRDAFQMLGFKKQSTFNELADRLGLGR